MEREFKGERKNIHITRVEENEIIIKKDKFGRECQTLTNDERKKNQQ